MGAPAISFTGFPRTSSFPAANLFPLFPRQGVPAPGPRSPGGKKMTVRYGLGFRMTQRGENILCSL